jgi:hypothetical protein
LLADVYKKLPPLFLVSDEEVDNQEESYGNSTLIHTQSRPKKNKTKKTATATIVDDDSDEGVTFKGFQGRRK